MTAASSNTTTSVLSTMRRMTESYAAMDAFDIAELQDCRIAGSRRSTQIAEKCDERARAESDPRHALRQLQLSRFGDRSHSDRPALRTERRPRGGRLRGGVAGVWPGRERPPV